MYLEDKLEHINKILLEIKANLDNLSIKPEKEVLDNQDVMQLLKISPRALQNYRDLGVIPFYKVEGKIYYKKSEILKTIEENRIDL